MTNFEQFTEDTGTLARLLMLIQGSSCDDCIAQEECEKLQQTGSTYRVCSRSWDAWLNKEV